MPEVQYRSDPSIVGFSSQHFYGGKLRSDASVSEKVWVRQIPRRVEKTPLFFEDGAERPPDSNASILRSFLSS
jgi:superfamily I DNA and/or RNA helicase